MALAVDITTSTQGSLLALPLEIRLMIYDLVMLSQPGRGELRSYHCGEGKQIQRSGYRRGSGKEGVCDFDQGLFLVNRQIYFEMEHLLHKNPLCLTIVDSLSCSSYETAKPLERLTGKCNWVQPNTKEVRLQLSCSSSSWRVIGEENKTREVVSKNAQDLQRILDQVEAYTIISDFWRAFFCLCYHMSKMQTQRQTSLKPVTKLLSSFPKLESIELLWPHSSAAHTWPSFWDDLRALITSKPACSIRIILSSENAIVDLFWFLQEHGGRLLRTSTWQYGEHSFGEDDVESKTWRRIGLDTGLRWENTWRVSEGSRSGGLSVDVLIRES